MDYHNPQTLCNRLSACLTSMPDLHLIEKSGLITVGTSNSEEYFSPECDMLAEQSSRLWISKWVDYSNKYGFGAQLSNGCIVIRYNDGTTLAVDSQKRYFTDY